MFCDMVGFTALVSRVDPEILQNIVSKVSGAGEVSGGCPVPELTYLD